jgi:ribosome-binding protein aMBF1 (putative translation factor)
MNPVQVIKENNVPRFAVIDWDLFLKLQDLIEDLEDVAETKRLMNDPVEGKSEVLNLSEFFDNPIKIARIKLGLTQKELAEKLGVSQPYIAKAEKGIEYPKSLMEKIEQLEI